LICAMEVLDATGHLTLEWDPDDAESVKRAEAEFEKLRQAGFSFFTSAGPDASRVLDIDDELSGRGKLDARLVDTRQTEMVQTRKFPRRKQRTVAVRQMRGG
jgi:hypothetical protein